MRFEAGSTDRMSSICWVITSTTSPRAQIRRAATTALVSTYGVKL